MYAIHELRFNTFEQEVLFCGVVKGLPAMFSDKAGENVHVFPDGEYVAEFPGQNRRYIATPFNPHRLYLDSEAFVVS